MAILMLFYDDSSRGWTESLALCCRSLGLYLEGLERFHRRAKEPHVLGSKAESHALGGKGLLCACSG